MPTLNRSLFAVLALNPSVFVILTHAFLVIPTHPFFVVPTHSSLVILSEAKDLIAPKPSPAKVRNPISSGLSTRVILHIAQDAWRFFVVPIPPGLLKTTLPNIRENSMREL